jgi:hypothetical protein
VGLACLAACLGDPVGPGAALLVRRFALPDDTVLVGAPGRALPAPVAFEVVDGTGTPVEGAVVVWTVADTSGRVEEAAAASDARGRFSASWVLGTRASVAQQLTVKVEADGHAAVAVVTAVAQPVEVSGLAFSDETTTVKLGLPSEVRVQATDPYGNVFVPERVAFTSLDTAHLLVDSSGAVQPHGRGYARLVATSGGMSDTAWVHVIQIVKAIQVVRDTIRFRSIGEGQRVAAILVDENGFAVEDSVPSVAPTDPGIVTVSPTDPLVVQSLGNGVAALQLQAGDVSRDVVAVVRQRTTTVVYNTSGISFEALTDTVRPSLTVLDSLGVPVASPAITFASSDTLVATVDGAGLVTACGNGSAVVTARSRSGAAAALPVTVAQRVATLAVQRDSLQFAALQAVLPAGVVLRDRLGSPVGGAEATYASDDPAIALVDPAGNVRAVANGRTTIRATHAAGSAAVAVQVAQRPVRLALSPPTVRFAALGDTATVSGVAVDSLGSPLAGEGPSVRSGDTAVVAVVGATLRARDNGATMASVTVAGVTADVPVVVDQVATALSVAVAFSGPVVTLPAGTSLPLACEGKDRNGFAIPRDPALIRSVRGTVTGAGCSDARVERSGYDTLVFALDAVQARVPVIVATRPDSVGILAAAQPLTTVEQEQFVGENLGSPLILALRPLIAEILGAYGSPTTNLGRARAIRDWVARTAVIGDAAIHPDNSTSNLSVLPPGARWADVNRVNTPAKWDEDHTYWDAQRYDGYAMLDRLLGTLDLATGVRADDGLMEHVVGARYRIRDIPSYHYTLCTFQAIIANVLWAAAGLQGVRGATIGHDPGTVFIPELGRWVYEDPTFDEEYLLDGEGEPLSPTDLLSLSIAGQAGRLRAVKLSGPAFDPETYAAGWTYFAAGHPSGMLVMGGQLNGRVVDAGWAETHYVQIDVAGLAAAPWPLSDPTIYHRVTPQDAFPSLGVVVSQLAIQDSVYVIGLSSTLPDHDHFERRTNGGLWERVPESDVLPVGACRIEYRSVNAISNTSASAVLDVWAPRTPEFLEAGTGAGIRRQARLCV